MIIGVPKESKVAEYRVALIPEDCQKLIQHGCQVLMQTGAGIGAGFDDTQYQQAGVTLISGPEPLYEQANLIVKVKEPQAHELPLFQPHHTLFAYLHLASNPQLVTHFMRLGLTAIGFETVQKEQSTPLLHPMSAIAGRLSIQIGAQLLHKSHGGRGVLLGGLHLQPAGAVTVIGAGSVGFEAALLASKMGAKVSVLDIDPARLHWLSAQLNDVHCCLSNPETISQLLPQTDLLIGAVYIPGKKAPYVVTTEQMTLMAQHTVAVDVAIDQGGCFETSKPCTHLDPSFISQGVIHSAITNLPAAVPETASRFLSNAIMPYVQYLALSQSEEEWPIALTKGIYIQDHQLKIAL